MTTTLVKPGGEHVTDEEIGHAMVPAGSHALGALVDSPLPIFTGEQMAKALTAYRDLQTALDRSMPDQIMDIEGRKFRKKGYWRAIAVAFGLTVEPVAERRETNGLFKDGRDNFGYLVTYRATAPNGRQVNGDGSCFAVEKARRFKCPHPERPGSRRTVHWPAHTCPDFDPEFQWRTLPGEATEHNVRSHAHTRAFNRAVSNLVGFGEVSAEEVMQDGTVADAPPADRGDQAATAPAPRSSAPATAPQRRSGQPAATPPAGAGLTVQVKVTDISSTKGQGQKGPWERWTIRGSDDRKYATFDAAIAQLADDAREAGQHVAITYTEGKYGRDLMAIALVDRDPGAEG